MKKKRINYLGFLSFLALIAVLGYCTENTGLYGFLGFLYYIRYFRVIPDELFRQNTQKAATVAWISELLILVPLMFICNAVYDPSKAIRTAFGLSFAVAIFIFTIVLMILEYKESAGIADD